MKEKYKKGKKHNTVAKELSLRHKLSFSNSFIFENHYIPNYEFY